MIEKNDAKIKTIKFLWQFIKKYKIGIFLITSLIIIGDQLDIIGSNLILKNFVNKISNNELTYKESIFYGISYLISINSLMFILILVRKLEFPILFKLKEDIRNSIFQNSLKQSNSFFNENFVGSLNSKINDITNGISSIMGKLFDIISNILAFIAVGIIILKTSLSMGIIFFILFVFYILVFIKLSIKIEQSSEETSKKDSECSGKIIDCFTNILNIKIFSTLKKEKSNIKQQSLTILKNRSKLEYYKGLKDTLNAVFKFTLTTTMFFLNLNLLFKDKIEIGTMVININLTGVIFWWLKNTIEMIMECIEEFGKVNQAVETLFVNPEIIDNKNAKKLVVNDGKIEFKNLYFKYKENLPYVFDNLNLTINSKQKVGLVGYSGSGKSSLISLLLRFYDITSGNLLIDNQDIKVDITQESLRKNISYIPQEPILFHRTIRENILYGKNNASEEELIEATKKAYCYDFIQNLENGFDTLVGERGVKLSGGQRQRIAIARAILKNAPILILDEATSALDSITEKEIQKAIENLMENKTTIVVAHRLSTLNNMDRIIVLDKGKIIEDGNKENLLKIENGLFKTMWEMQRNGIVCDE